MEKVEKVIDEMENGNIPNAAINKDDKIVDIFIQPDLSQDERDERKKLRAELISRREAGEKYLIIRRGRIWKQGSFRP